MVTALRKRLMRLFVLLICCLRFSGAFTQNCVSLNNNAVFNFSCNINCGPVNIQAPDLRSASDYTG
jgi:hypothetical protein